jgi:hypothetical protein
VQPKQNPGYVNEAYLKVLSEMVAPVKRRSYELMHLQPGQKSWMSAAARQPTHFNWKNSSASPGRLSAWTMIQR